MSTCTWINIPGGNQLRFDFNYYMYIQVKNTLGEMQTNVSRIYTDNNLGRALRTGMILELWYANSVYNVYF